MEETTGAGAGVGGTGSGSGSGLEAAEQRMEQTFERITQKQMRVQEKFAERSTELSIAKKQIQ